MFQYSLTGKGGSGSGFGSRKTVPAVPVLLLVSGKNGSDGSGSRFQFGSWATLFFCSEFTMGQRSLRAKIVKQAICHRLGSKMDTFETHFRAISS